MPIVDAQVHVWEPEPTDHPWPEGGQEAAAIHRKPLGPDELLGLMAEAGVDCAILVPPFFEGFRDGYAIKSARAHPDRFRVMPRLDVRAPHRAEKLDTLVAEPVVSGLRFVLVERAGIMLSDEALEWLWPIASDRDVPVAFHAPGQLASVARLAERFPDLRIAVDHLGQTGAEMDADIEPAIDELVALRRFPNISVKATTVLAYSTEPYPTQRSDPSSGT